MKDENEKPDDHPAGIVIGGGAISINGEVVSCCAAFYVNRKSAGLPEKPQGEKE